MADYHISRLLRLAREAQFCVSCIATARALKKLDVIAHLSTISGVVEVTFTPGHCAQCNQPRAIVRAA